MEISYYAVIAVMAIIIHSILNSDILLKRDSEKTKAYKCYRRFLKVALLYYVADALWGIIESFKFSKLLYADTVLYFIFMALSVVYWCRYVVSYLNLKKTSSLLMNISGDLYFVVQVIVLIINHFHPVLFSVGEACDYHAYFFRYVVLAAQMALFTSVASINLIRTINSRRSERTRNISISIFGFEMAMTAVIQYLFPMFPAYSMGLLIGVCFLHVFVLEDEKNEIRLAAEANLRVLQDRSDIISNAGYGIWKIVIRPDGENSMEADDKLLGILGVADMNLDPEELYEYYHKHLLENVVEIENDDYSSMMEGEVRSRLLAWEHPVKGKIFLRAGGSSHVLESGEKIISGYCGDITEQKLDADRQSARLKFAKKQAEEANEAKTAFLFNTSHDIRIPMNAIVGYVDLVEKNLQNAEKCRSYLEKIRGSSNFLLCLINNVLEISRIESGKVTVNERVIDIDNMENFIKAIFGELLKAKGIDFELSKNVTHRYIFGDVLKLRAVYMNLVSNACKYTAAGGKISLKIEEIPCEEDGFARFKITVADTGIGMTPEFLPKLFEGFSNSERLAEGLVEGTGLGMHIIKRYLELMGGEISVESEPGKGSVFTIISKHRVSDESELQQEQKNRVDVSLLRGKRVILAEDNDLNAEIETEMLKSLGVIVDRVVDGKECVKLISESSVKYDAIFMDLKMPNMDGFEACKTIRKLDDLGKALIPIIAMTADAFEEDRKSAFSVGMNGHISKPVDVEKLAQKLLEIF